LSPSKKKQGNEEGKIGELDPSNEKMTAEELEK